MKAKEPKVKKEKVEKKPTEKKSLFAKKEIPEWKKELKEKQKQDPLTTKDYVCWGLFILCLIIGMVPYALRAIDPTYDDSLSFSEKIKGNSSTGVEKKNGWNGWDGVVICCEFLAFFVRVVVIKHCCENLPKYITLRLT